MPEKQVTVSIPIAVIKIDDAVKSSLREAFRTTLANKLTARKWGDDVSIMIENNKIGSRQPRKGGYAKGGTKARKGSAKAGAAKKKVSKKK